MDNSTELKFFVWHTTTIRVVYAKFESNLSTLKFRHFGPARPGGQNFKVLRFSSNLAWSTQMVVVCHTQNFSSVELSTYEWWVGLAPRVSPPRKNPGFWPIFTTRKPGEFSAKTRVFSMTLYQLKYPKITKKSNEIILKQNKISSDYCCVCSDSLKSS